MKKRKILLIDDEPDVVYYLSSFLEDHGYEVCSAHDAESGLELIGNEKPDMVLLDVMMPGQSGLNFLISIRNRDDFSDMPVVLVSGSEKIREKDFGSFLKRSGARPPDDIIEKPIDPGALLAVVDRILADGEDEFDGAFFLENET